MSENDNPEELLGRVPAYLEAGRQAEAERLLIAVLRGAEEGSALHWEGLICLAELYESEQRYREGLIVGREIPRGLDPTTELGERGIRLMARLHQAEDEAELAERCLELLR